MTADWTQLKELPPDGLIGSESWKKPQKRTTNNLLQTARSQNNLAANIHNKAINCTSFSGI